MNACIIPARGGSKRIPRKNIKDFYGLPVIAYSIATARESNMFGMIAVSTDDAEIAAIAHKFGAGVLDRSERAAADDATDYDVLRDVVEQITAEYICYLYPVAPMVTPRDLQLSLNSNVKNGYVTAAKGQFYWLNVERFKRMTPGQYYDAFLPYPVDYPDVDTPEDWDKLRAAHAAQHGILAR